MMKKALVLSMLAALATVSQAVLIDSFVNADFDSGIVTTGNGSFAGFDAPAAPEIEGWTNYGNVYDGGVEASGAWWIQGYINENCGFVNAGGGAYNMSTYTIQAGDVFTVSVYADAWGSGQITAYLFYDDPANIIGSYVFTPNAWHFDTWTDTVGITATSASVGGTLGVLIMNTGGANIVGFDEVTVNVVPEPATMTLLCLGGLSLIRRKK